MCSHQAGTAEAMIPDTAKAMGTVRTLYARNREQRKDPGRAETDVQEVSNIYQDQVKGELNHRGRCFPVYNDPEMVPNVKNSVQFIYEKGFYIDETMKIGGEDLLYQQGSSACIHDCLTAYRRRSIRYIIRILMWMSM